MSCTWMVRIAQAIISDHQTATVSAVSTNGITDAVTLNRLQECKGREPAQKGRPRLIPASRKGPLSGAPSGSSATLKPTRKCGFFPASAHKDANGKDPKDHWS